MHICKAQPDEIDKIKDIWQICFNDKIEFVEFFFNSRYSCNNTLCVWEADTIVSCLQLLPYKLNLRGKIIDASYIVGVATLPDHRSRGYARQLLHYALDQMYRDKIPVSVLLPFNYSFYSKYGWAVCYEYLKYIGLNNNNLSIDSRCKGSFKEIELKSDYIMLDYCYNSFMKSYNSYIHRSKDDWFRLIKDCMIDNGSGYIYLKDGEPLGYFLYIIENNKLLIRELAYLSAQDKESILTYVFELSQQLSSAGNSDSINWNAPADDLTYLNMPDSRGHLFKEAYLMGRINNVIAALDGIPAETDDFIINIKVIDPFYMENNSTYLLSAERGVIRLTKSYKPYDVVLTVNVLTQILWGYITPVQAYKNGFIDTNSIHYIKKLECIFPGTIPYIIEDY